MAPTGDAGPEQPIVLRLPADESLIHIARLTASGVAARAGLTIDRLEDLKLAVSEALIDRLETRAGVRWVQVAFSLSDAALVVEVVGDESEGGGDPGDESSYALALMESVVDEVHGDHDEEGRSVTRLIIRLPGTGGQPPAGVDAGAR